jgi:hypothetical protein
MTVKKTPLTIDPQLEALAQQVEGWFVPIIQAGINGIFKLPEGIDAFTRTLNLAMQESQAARAAILPDKWQDKAINDAVANLLKDGPTTESIRAVSDDLARMETESTAAVWRWHIAESLVAKLMVAQVMHTSVLLPPLRAAVAEVLAEVALLPDSTPTSLQQARDDRAGWDDYDKLEEAEGRYLALRSCWRILRVHEEINEPATIDQFGHFQDTWVQPDGDRPTAQTLTREILPAGEPATPYSSLARLVWLSGKTDGRTRCWLPSRSDQDQAYRAWRGGPVPGVSLDQAGVVPFEYQDIRTPDVEGYVSPPDITEIAVRAGYTQYR